MKIPKQFSLQPLIDVEVMSSQGGVGVLIKNVLYVLLQLGVESERKPVLMWNFGDFFNLCHSYTLKNLSIANGWRKFPPSTSLAGCRLR